MKAHVGLALALGLVVIQGCGDGGGDAAFVLSNYPTLEAFSGTRPLGPGDTIEASAGTLLEGERGIVAALQLVNTGSAPLEVSAITIIAQPPGSLWVVADEDLAPLDAASYIVAPSSGGESEQLNVYVAMQRSEGITPRGTLRIHSNAIDPDTGASRFDVRYELVVTDGAPRLQAVPGRVDFGVISIGREGTEVLRLVNAGDVVASVDGLVFSGHDGFRLSSRGRSYTPGTYAFDPPLRVAPGATEEVRVTYVATGPEAARGLVRIHSNTRDAGEAMTVELAANVSGPCMRVSPGQLDFGGKFVGVSATIEFEIASCSDVPVRIDQIALSDASSPELELRLDGFAPDGLPVVIQPGHRLRVPVRYVPLDKSPVGPDGLPIRDRGTVVITANTIVPEHRVEVQAFGVCTACPTAVIVVAEGEEVATQTRLHLIGSQSLSAQSQLTQFTWRATQPSGSASTFRPSAGVPDPTFEVNVAGRYTFELEVSDALGLVSCAPARVEVVVVPDDAIHIELLWRTPNDDDESDEGPEAGADIDLHFVHPAAVADQYDGDGDGEPDGYFDAPFDAYWFNQRPNWGAFSGSDDDPALERDDTDGAGPENLDVPAPEAKCYKLGAHYWDDHGFGESFARARIYYYGNLVLETPEVRLVMGDMWTVSDVCWPPDPETPPALRQVCGDRGGCRPLVVPRYELPGDILAP